MKREPKNVVELERVEVVEIVLGLGLDGPIEIITTTKLERVKIPLKSTNKSR